MKKILVSFIVVGTCSLMLQTANAAGVFDTSPIQSDVGRLQNPYQDLKLLEQDRFRKTEYNEFDDMKTVKEKRNNKLKYEQKLQEPARPTTPQSSNVQLYMENGQLKLKSVQ